MAPAGSLARMRKAVLDRAARGEVSVVQACRDAGWSRSRFYELRHRYRTYGEAGLLPKPRSRTRPDRWLCAPLVDQIVAYAVEHPTEGPRSIAARLALPRFGSWRVSHGGGVERLVPGRPGPQERPSGRRGVPGGDRGPITERILRELRAREVTHRHIGSDVVGEQVFFDTMYVGRLKGVGKVWQYSAVDGACSFGFAKVRAGEKSARAAAAFLEHDVLPSYAEAGITLKEVVIDGGPEFKGGVPQDLCSPGDRGAPDPSPLPGPQRLRGALPGNGPSPAPLRVPVPLLRLGD
ncbi:MAG: helix-turn-helix domain-containing protein [Actinomycetota bacterium]|nr:helix-turn-helix domain-containing protein [Actinomycetota bacterium]